MNHSLFGTAKVDLWILGVEVNAHARALLIKFKHRRANKLVFDLKTDLHHEITDQANLGPTAKLAVRRNGAESTSAALIWRHPFEIPDRFSVSFKRYSLD